MPVEEVLALSFAGERLLLDARRGIFWPARGLWMVSDLHLGKDDAFRAAGMAVPQGQAAADLDRLSALLESQDARSLWVLGDFLHTRQTPNTWGLRWSDFRRRHARIEITVVAGNHDRALRGGELGINVLHGAQSLAPFVLQHHPDEAATAASICGHLHPVAWLPALRYRAPVFAIATNRLVLPAFSAFTGGWPIPHDWEFVACADGLLVDGRRAR